MPVPTAILYPNTLVDTLAWLQGHPLLTALIGNPGRVYFRLPTKPVFPCLRLYQAGGAPVPGEAPEDGVRISIEIWGELPSDYLSLLSIEAALKSAFQPVSNVMANPAGNTLLLYAACVSAVDAPDSDLGWPRRVVDFVVNSRLAP